MSQDAQTLGGLMNTLKWAIVIALIAGGIAGNFHFADQSALVRTLALLGISAVCVAIAMQTTHGQRLWNFALEARTELRKVVWPTRPEVTQMTGIVLVLVTIVGLMLWGIDTLLLRIVGWLTGLGA